MYALRRAEVAELNAAAQALHSEAGEAGEALKVAGRKLAVGDDVIATRNDRQAGLVNGLRGTVTGVGEGSMTLRTAGGAEITVPGAYLEAGTSTTRMPPRVHKAQGATVERAFVWGDDAVYREAGYVALSPGAGAHRPLPRRPHRRSRATSVGRKGGRSWRREHGCFKRRSRWPGCP